MHINRRWRFRATITKYQCISRFARHISRRYGSEKTLKSQRLSRMVTPIASQLLHPKIETLRSSFSWLISRYAHTAHNSSSITFEENPERYCPGGYHPVHIGENFNSKYRIESKLGYGVYSTVWLTTDLTSQPPRHVALKILTADSYGSLKPVYELDILKHMSQQDPSHPGYKHVVHLLDSFVHEGPNGKHLCLVLELMGQTVFDLQQHFPNKQLPVHIGRQIAEQTLHVLDWLHVSCGIIHTDIKPDNILIEIPDVEEAVQNHVTKLKESNIGQPQDFSLMSRPIVNESSKFNIRITDFGVASWKDNHLTERIQPLSLRAPEVFLGAPWDNSVDVWGFACVIYELLQGRVLFRGRPGPKDAWTAEEDQIAQTIELFGPIPSSIRKRGKLSSNFFDETGNLLHIKQLYPYLLRDLLAQTTNNSMSVDDYEQFEVFLRAMLQYEPSDRKKPKELLKEQWLSKEVSSPSALKSST